MLDTPWLSSPCLSGHRAQNFLRLPWCRTSDPLASGRRPDGILFSRTHTLCGASGVIWGQVMRVILAPAFVCLWGKQSLCHEGARVVLQGQRGQARPAPHLSAYTCHP